MTWSIYIEERPAQFGPIDNALFGRDVAHSFLRFKDDDTGKTLMELHGMAVTRDTLQPKRYPADLKTCFSAFAYGVGIPNQMGPVLHVYGVTDPALMDKISYHEKPDEQLLVRGDQRTIMGYMDSALHAADAINDARLDYYPFAVDGNGRNCNSVTETLVEHTLGSAVISGDLRYAMVGMRSNLEPAIPSLKDVHPGSNVNTGIDDLMSDIRNEFAHPSMKLGHRKDTDFFAAPATPGIR